MSYTAAKRRHEQALATNPAPTSNLPRCIVEGCEAPATVADEKNVWRCAAHGFDRAQCTSASDAARERLKQIRLQIAGRRLSDG